MTHFTGEERGAGDQWKDCCLSHDSSLVLLPDEPVLDILGFLTVKIPLEFFDENIL